MTLITAAFSSTSIGGGGCRSLSKKVQLKLGFFDRLKPAIFMAGFVCAFFYLLSNPKEVQYALPDCHIAGLGGYYHHGNGGDAGVIVAMSAAVA